MQTPGAYISAVGHVGLIGWLILGWGFSAEPLPFETMDVSVVSGEEFDQLVAASTEAPGEAEPDAPPVIEEVIEEPPVEEPIAEPVEEPIEPPVEELPLEEPPVVVDDAPDGPLQTLPQVTASPDLPVSDRPTPRPSDRITAQPVAPPPPDVDVADVPVEATEPADEPTPDVVEEPQPPAAPDVSVPEIALEDEAPTTAVTTSLRPQSRPARPAPAAEPEVTEDPAPDNADVLAALSDAQEAETPAATEAPALPLGASLSRIEKGNVISAIGRKWIVDNGAQSSNVVIRVKFSLNRDGTIDGDVEFVSATDAPQPAIDAAFRSARSAIWAVSRSGGLPLPAEKYEQWKDVIAEFDPSGMRLR